MATKLFVNLPVKDLGRSKAFFTSLGLDFFGQADDMASVIVPSEDNRNVIAMFDGSSAPQPPPPGSQFAPGCVVT